MRILLVLGLFLRATAIASVQWQSSSVFKKPYKPQPKVHHPIPDPDNYPAPAQEIPKDQVKSDNSTEKSEESVPAHLRHVDIDAIAKDTNGYLDNFVVIYWGCIFLVVAANVVRTIYAPDKLLLFYSHPSGAPQLAHHTKFFGVTDTSGRPTRELDANFWSLCLACCHEQVRDSQGRIARAWIMYAMAFIMGLTQLFALGLIFFDVNPEAHPWTSTPSAPWKETGTSVNCMKFVMVLFMSLSVVSEASGACSNLVSALELDSETLHIPKIFPLAIPCFHYVITLGTILGGVAVVLSCQQVPSILYNSLAILFITNFDELVYKFVEHMVDLDVDFNIPVNLYHNKWEKKHRLHLLIRQCFAIFPMVWAFALLGRAWYTNAMPVYTTLGMTHLHKASLVHGDKLF